MVSERQGTVAREGGGGGGARGACRHMHGVLQPGELITVENYIIRFYLSERTLKLGVRALANSLHTQRGTHSQHSDNHTWHVFKTLQSCTMHHGTEMCTQ